MTQIKKLITATFIQRHNRFVSSVVLNGREIRVYVPNTGRLSEMAIPGRKVLLVPSNGKYKYKMLYIFYKGRPIMIDSSYSNSLFFRLLEDNKVPHLKEYTMIKREPAYKNYRFDFLVKDKSGVEYFIELKSCTLAWNNTASFPDAISTRASAHINALAETGNGIVVLFLLHTNVNTFVPNYHTDFKFYEIFKNNFNKIRFLAYSVQYDKDYNIVDLKNVNILLPEAKPAGTYLMILFNEKTDIINIDKKNQLHFKKGYYIYIDHDDKNIFKKILALRSGIKNISDTFYLLKKNMKIISDIPIITEENIAQELSDKMKNLGCEGIKIPTYMDENSFFLFYSTTNPLHMEKFWDFVLKKRFNMEKL